MSCSVIALVQMTSLSPSFRRENEGGGGLLSRKSTAGRARTKVVEALRRGFAEPCEAGEVQSVEVRFKLRPDAHFGLHGTQTARRCKMPAETPASVSSRTGAPAREGAAGVALGRRSRVLARTLISAQAG